jgi:protein-tyrosine phosphatase
MLGKLFSRKRLSEPVELGGLVTDMHSHLIPGIDDGSPTLEASIELIKGMQSLGYKKLITTPHIGSDVYKNTFDIIQQGVAVVRKELARQKINMQIEAAAEYLIDDGFISMLKNDNLQTFGNKHILVELSYFHIPPNLFEITFELQIKGYKIILAHPERYLYWYNNMKIYEQLKDRGILFQLNMISLVGHYSVEVKKMAEKLIDAEMIDFLGSDLHNAFYFRALESSRYEIYLDKAIRSGKIQNHIL